MRKIKINLGTIEVTEAELETLARRYKIDGQRLKKEMVKETIVEAGLAELSELVSQQQDEEERGIP